MYVSNLTNSRGNKVVNQFIIRHDGAVWFQSYDSVIACVDKNNKLALSSYWDYSNTTLRHLYNFLRENWQSNVDRKVIENGIADGTIAYFNEHNLPNNFAA